MLLIGMFDSPFVRPVAISMKLLGIEFEHGNWSVGKDFERIREFNPLVRVPTLVLDDGEPLIDSAAILDYLDECAGPERALLPRSGRERRAALQFAAIASGAADKARELIYENVFRPPEKRHEPWLERCRSQMHGGLAELERRSAARGSGRWPVTDRITRAEIMLTCVTTFIIDAFGLTQESASYPALRAVVARCEALPEFQSTRVVWSAPQG